MSAQPVQPHEPEPRVPKTINGIAGALSAARRMDFYREIGEAQAGRELDELLIQWWGRAMLATDPDRDRIVAEAEAGTLPAVSLEEAMRQRIRNGGAVPRD